MTTGKKDSICLEESYNNPVADNYLWFSNIYTICLEENVYMPFKKGNQFSKGRSAWNKGMKGVFHHTTESKKKLSEARYGKFCGQNNPFFGKKHSEETIQKLREFKKNKPSPRKGIKCSEESKKRMSLAHKGKTPWNKGKKGVQIPWMKNKQHTKKSKERMSMVRKGKRIGDENSNWMGGISFLPYCHKFNKYLKETIRERDNRTCQLCNTNENEKKLTVHHIHYLKSDCEPDLITLCNKCNAKANFNRDYYETLFMNKLIERGIIKNDTQ